MSTSRRCPWPPPGCLSNKPHTYIRTTSCDEVAGRDGPLCTWPIADCGSRLHRALLLLLYGSGLRIGEALRLTLRDVDLGEGVITVRDTKFYKRPAGAGRPQSLLGSAALLRFGGGIRYQTRKLLDSSRPGPGEGGSGDAINIVLFNARVARAAGIVWSAR